MKIFIHLSISIFALFFFTGPAVPSDGTRPGSAPAPDLPEEIECTDNIYMNNIRTVELYRSGWRLSPPWRNLRDTTSLVLEFDDLNSDLTHFTYTLIHCTAEWEPSDIVNSEYLTGLTENEIRDYRYSRNALQQYKHYRLSFPNDDVQIKLPGNYILYVYKDYDQEEPVLTRRFYIVEPLTRINADIHRTDNINYLYSHQEVDFTVTYDRLEPQDPRRDFKVAICQNLNPATLISDLLPKYIQPGELIYDYEEENLFNGGTEYLHFDTKSLRYNSDRVREIRFERPLQHIYLLPDRPKATSTYEYQEDLNGRYLVKWDDAFDSDTEADYVHVHFQLATGDSIPETDIYVFGGLTDWAAGEESRCRFNPATSAYEADMLLKQGYYNYQFATQNRNNANWDFTLIDGNHYETENDYYIFVYYRDIRERFDRLVGLGIVNSVKRQGN